MRDTSRTHSDTVTDPVPPEPPQDSIAVSQSAEIALLRSRLHIAEEELARSKQAEERLRTFLTNSSDAIAVVDANGVLRYASPASRRMLGYAPGEYLGKNPFDLIHPDDLESVSAAFARLITEPAARVTSQYRVQRKDGSWIWLEGVGVNLLAEPSIHGIVINYRDIAERRQHEAEMEYVLTAAHCLLWHADAAYLSEDEPLDWRLWFPDEQAAYRFLALAVQEGQSFATTWHMSRPEEYRIHMDAYARQEILAGRDYRQQFPYRQADDRICWLAEDVHVETVAPGRWRLVGVCTDITTLKQREQEIEALNERLQEAMRETHHRVKNNLQLLSATIDVTSMREVDAASLAALERLKAQIQTLGALHDILTEAVRGEQHGQVVSARLMLHRLVPMLERTMGNRPFRYEIEDAPLPGYQCTALALVVQEIVANALKHGNGGVEIRFLVRNAKAILEVDDDGPGFPSDFDPARTASTGMELLQTLTRHDLSATLRFETRQSGGGRVVLEMPLAGR